MNFDKLVVEIQRNISDLISKYPRPVKGSLYISADNQELALSLSDIKTYNNSVRNRLLGGFIDNLTFKEIDEEEKSYELFVDLFQDLYQTAPIKESTKKNYDRTLCLLKEYAPLATFTDLDRKFIYGFSKFLLSLQLKPNTIVKHLKILKRIIHLAEKKGYITQSVESLFSLCDIKTEKTFKETLTIKEVLVLFHYLQDNFDSITKRDREILSGFLFSCFTGLRYSDISQVEYSNIKRIRNKKWLCLKMKKTEQMVLIPIEQMFSGKALQVMNLFHRTRGKLFYMPSNAISNRILKKIYKEQVGKKKAVSFHTARHTAATLLLYHNTPLTTIQQILGHSNIRTTEVYADINQETIYNSISKVKFKELDKVDKRIMRSLKK